MARQIISTPAAPGSPIFAQGVRVGGQVHVSGMTGLDVATGELAGPGIAEQTEQALANCEHVLRAAGGSREDIVEVGVLLAHPEDFGGLNEAWARHFPEDPPTRYVARLGPEIPGVLVSVRMTAVLERP